jgi:NAD(P)-dependent dehydrogenase (short-subunit alcohol dehydrogenase family)
MSGKKSVLVYGGAGQLGACVVAAFAGRGWAVASADLAASSGAAVSVVLDRAAEPAAQAAQVLSELAARGDEYASLSAVVCVAGGWSGSGAADAAVFADVGRMLAMNVWPAVAAAHVAAARLAPGGLLALTGAAAALGPTAGALGYGMAKAATHQLGRSLAAPGGLPRPAVVAAVAPVILDTASNRAAMPSADVSSWTPLHVVADLLLAWASDAPPRSGTLHVLRTTSGKTDVEVLDL